MAMRGERAVLSLAQQYLLLKNSDVGNGVGLLEVTGLTWEYRERPTPLSREYKLRIEYPRGEVPNVSVVAPNISALAGGRELPHVYRNPLRLCLYLPRSGEWDPTMRLDRTFVAWASVWLFYFEEWLASNKWKGGGIHPDDDRGLNRQGRRAVRRA